MADLRLDLKDDAFRTREAGAPVVPGDAAASLIYQRIVHSDVARRMPPAHSHKTLDPEQIETIKTWIEQGAEWNDHWSFQTPERPQDPAVKDGSWARNSIDRFVLARLESEGVTPAPEADRRTLARRAALDITGLPPTPAVVERFLNDTSPDAYEHYLDRLLATPQYGEHRARYWLDAARYADTHGIHVDNYREMWPYRDWVINAFNGNLPFDEFTVEQIAGDLLPNPTLDQLVATGFHRCSATTNENGIVPEEFEAIYAKDRADTTGTVFLGLTVGCATCHDHKFDPITQKDFYAMTAFYRNTTQDVMDGNISDTPPFVVVPRADDARRLEQLKAKLRSTEQQLEGAEKGSDKKFESWINKGKYRSLESPLAEDAEAFLIDAAEFSPSREVNTGEGPTPNIEGLIFGSEGLVEVQSTVIGGAKPFSMALWVYHPEKDGSFAVASQSDPEDKLRGWELGIRARQISFRMTTVRNGEAERVTVQPATFAQLEPGGWRHVTVTYDGSGERAGMHFYYDGAVIPTIGSEYFTKLNGSIASSQPIRLGQGFVEAGGEFEPYYFAGGGIADFRLFDRELSVQEAKVVASWPTLSAARESAPDALTDEQRDVLRLRYLSVESSKYNRLVDTQRELDRELREIRRRGAVTHVMQEKPGGDAMAHVLFRGMYDQRRDAVKARTPGFLPPMDASFPANRLGLARWLVDESNPLVSRVTVNRFWQEVFGTALVRTSDDFGAQGEQPSHAELLDWLAVDFRDSGWDVKRLFKNMLTSSTYRQSAETTAAKVEMDPENRLLSRGPRFRMDGEMIRDYALAVSGLLVPKIGGPSVKPYQPDGVWAAVAMSISNTRAYERDTGDKLYRRSLYTFWKRAAPPASMQVFNAPTREHTTVRRERTNTPLQALVTMNDPQFVEAARHLAQNAMRQAGDEFDARLDYLSARLLARPFNDSERAVTHKSYERLVAHYQANPDEARQLLTSGESKPDETLAVVESASLTMLANQMMNLDEVLNK